MACINMLNNHQCDCGAPPPMGPRISFSNDFADEPPMPPPPRMDMTPPDPNFEFAVGGQPMIAADELFFKGRLLPLHEHGHRPPALVRATTLRDELRAGDEWARPSKISLRWKEFLGLRRAHSGPLARKNDKGDWSSSSAAAAVESPVRGGKQFSTPGVMGGGGTGQGIQ